MKKTILGIFLLFGFYVNAQYTFEQIDIWSGSNGSSPRYITEFNGEIYFQVIEITPSFRKLYKSNGTSAGTQLVAGNLNSGAGYSPESLYVMNGELFFTASVSGLGTELYKTDGTDAGTVLVKDVRSGSSNGLDGNFIRMGSITVSVKCILMDFYIVLATIFILVRNNTRFHYPKNPLFSFLRWSNLIQRFGFSLRIPTTVCQISFFLQLLESEE